jgi:hypothetical protein
MKTLGRLLVAGLVVAVVSAGVVLWMKLAPRRVPPGQPPLLTLNADSLWAVREAFNASRDEVRVLAMLSPT